MAISIALLLRVKRLTEVGARALGCSAIPVHFPRDWLSGVVFAPRTTIAVRVDSYSVLLVDSRFSEPVAAQL